jgi:hypothetical protein
MIETHDCGEITLDMLEANVLLIEPVARGWAKLTGVKSIISATM